MSSDEPEPTSTRFVGYLDASDRVEYGSKQPWKLFVTAFFQVQFSRAHPLTAGLFAESRLDCLSSWSRTVSSSHGTCCGPDRDCEIPTTCLDDTLYYQGSSSTWFVANAPIFDYYIWWWLTTAFQSCSDDSSSCATLSILPRSGDSDATRSSTLDFFCNRVASGSPFSVLYLEDPVRETGSTRTTTQPEETGRKSPTRIPHEELADNRRL